MVADTREGRLRSSTGRRCLSQVAGQALGVTAFAVNGLVLEPGQAWYPSPSSSPSTDAIATPLGYSGPPGPPRGALRRSREGDEVRDEAPLPSLCHVEPTPPRRVWNAVVEPGRLSDRALRRRLHVGDGLARDSVSEHGGCAPAWTGSGALASSSAGEHRHPAPTRQPRSSSSPALQLTEALRAAGVENGAEWRFAQVSWFGLTSFVAVLEGQTRRSGCCRLRAGRPRKLPARAGRPRSKTCARARSGTSASH